MKIEKNKARVSLVVRPATEDPPTTATLISGQEIYEGTNTFDLSWIFFWGKLIRKRR